MHSILRVSLLVAWLSAAFLHTSAEADWTQQFHSLIASLCIRSEFTETHSSSYGSVCAVLCSIDQRCQAFTAADGPCQLFVFDKCSKSVRDCSCSKRGRLFVKRQSGLEPGALCPPGYGNGLCGVKYRILHGSGSWSTSRQRCESEPGLVIMADVMDSTEMEHVERLYSNSSISGSLWLGGFQLLGSSEPADGWVWASCGGSISARLWATDEPTNSGRAENVTGRFKPKVGITDLRDALDQGSDALCECISPFD